MKHDIRYHGMLFHDSTMVSRDITRYHDTVWRSMILQIASYHKVLHDTVGLCSILQTPVRCKLFRIFCAGLPVTKDK